MARPQRFLCLHCEGRLNMGDSFCDTCGYPTIWAAHQDRVRWEVQQWRRMQSGASSAVKPVPAVVGTAVRRPEPAHPTPKIERKDWSYQVGWRKAMATSRSGEAVAERSAETRADAGSDADARPSNGTATAPEPPVAAIVEPAVSSDEAPNSTAQDAAATIDEHPAGIVPEPNAVTAPVEAAEAASAPSAPAPARPRPKKAKRPASPPAASPVERPSVFATLASIPAPPAPAPIKPDADDIRDERVLAQIRSLHQRLQAAEVRIAALEARPVSQGFFARFRARPAANG